jgi:hypothetical protein
MKYCYITKRARGSSDDTCNFGDDVSEVVPRDASEGSDCDENDA